MNNSLKFHHTYSVLHAGAKPSGGFDRRQDLMKTDPEGHKLPRKEEGIVIQYLFVSNHISKLAFSILNKMPADQQDTFRTNCSSNDTISRLKRSHCTMKTHKSLMKKVLTFFEKCHPISEENTWRTHLTLICFVVGQCQYQNLTHQFFISLHEESLETSKIGKF